MDLASVIRRRLNELGIEQRDLAVAAQVTESYISQLLTTKKMPPAPHRTELYNRIGKLLQLPSGELGRLAATQRREQLKQKILDSPPPLFPEFRQFILRRCVPAKRKQIALIFERESFGEFERFIAQMLLTVAKQAAAKRAHNKEWTELVARLNQRGYEETRRLVFHLLETDVFHISLESCVPFLDPLIQNWNIDLESFSLEITLNRKLAPDRVKRLEFQEVKPESAPATSPGLEDFLNKAELNADLTESEIFFLKQLTVPGKQPSWLYYHRELQNLRDPLNFVSLPLNWQFSTRKASEVRKSAFNGEGPGT